MADIGHGYGSECHLLRYLGRHRKQLDDQICEATDAAQIRWLDFPFNPTNSWKDGEWKGLDFLPADDPARLAWPEFWPVRGNPQNWDAVARVKFGSSWEWLLVEAKAHVEELHSNCGASEAGGRPMIRKSLARVKEKLGAESGGDWLENYYQYANRLTVLWHMVECGTPTRLLFIYFTGDEFPDNAFDCPADEQGWAPALEAQRQYLGLEVDHSLSDRVHKIFSPVLG